LKLSLGCLCLTTSKCQSYVQEDRIYKFLFNTYRQLTNSTLSCLFTELDRLGIPSTITIDGKPHSLNCSIDRVHLKKSIVGELIKNFGYDNHQSKTIAEFYCEEKYEDYKKVILSL